MKQEAQNFFLHCPWFFFPVVRCSQRTMWTLCVWHWWHHCISALTALATFAALAALAAFDALDAFDVLVEEDAGRVEVLLFVLVEVTVGESASEAWGLPDWTKNRLARISATTCFPGCCWMRHTIC